MQKINVKKILTKFEFWLVIIILSLAIFTRFYALKTTATFFWDQAYDLRQIQLFYTEKRISLIGPISEEGDKVYSSLTYYMLLPFAVLGKFSTVSTTYGAAVYGLLSAVFLVVLITKINKKAWLGAALVAAIWFPLIETSRWAWNPHLVLIWIALGLLFFQRKTKLTLFLSGLFLGLSIHHHYLSFIATAAFIFLTLLQKYKSRDFKTYLWLVPGFAFAILPFIAFDLTHPPGLFFSRLMMYQQNNVNRNLVTFIFDFFHNFYTVVRHYAGPSFSGALLAIYLLALMLFDFKKSKKHLLFIIVWFLQILGVTFIKDAYTHYFLPGLVFFVIYLYLPRKIIKVNIVLVSTFILINGSLLSIVPQITTQKYMPAMWQPNIRTADAITNILYHEVTQNNISGANIAVLGSPDPNRYGWKYRSLLEIKGVQLKSKYEYFTNNYLFVVSTQTEENLRNDISPEMERFRYEKLLQTWYIEDSEWIVYLFSF